MKSLLTMAAMALGITALPALARAEAPCAALKDVRLPHVEITAVTTETVASGQACRISATSRPTADSDIRMEIWIPVGGAWNGKYVQYGNGGFAGSIRSGQLSAAAARGYAAAATDDGHQAGGQDGRWALNHPEKVIDFGYRALKETTDTAKALIAFMKGSRPQKSYFQGCSDGGREALMEAQRYPADWDGIVAGAPANNWTGLLAVSTSTEQAIATPESYLTQADLALVQAAVLRQCGGEAFVRDPTACRFDPASIQCRPNRYPESCLAPAKVAALKQIYRGLVDPRSGQVLYPGYTPGAEAQPGSWNTWITGPSREQNAMAASHQFGSNYFRYFAFSDPAFDFLKLDLGAQLAESRRRLAPILDSANPNLSAFRARGGKLLQYHGWNDPAIPALGSIAYFEDVRRTMGDTSGFYRLFMVPGMLHCAGGASPTAVDWLAILDKWVTENAAPATITARTAAAPSATPATDAPSQLLCPYPAIARRTGRGAIGDAAAYACRAGPRIAVRIPSPA